MKCYTLEIKLINSNDEFESSCRDISSGYEDIYEEVIKLAEGMTKDLLQRLK